MTSYTLYYYSKDFDWSDVDARGYRTTLSAHDRDESIKLITIFNQRTATSIKLTTSHDRDEIIKLTLFNQT
jgi:hypothetical protein